MGLSIAQMALLGGADDAGSTMMEENVVSASGTSKMEASEIELQDAIIRAGSSLGEEIPDMNFLTLHLQQQTCLNWQPRHHLNSENTKQARYLHEFLYHRHLYPVAHILGH